MTARVSRRLLLPGLLLAPALGAALWRHGRAEQPEIVRIELAQGRAQLILDKRRDTGAWVVASADDAPGDPARIAEFVDSVLALWPEGSASVPLPAGEPMELRLTAADDRVVRHLALWPGAARRLPDGAPFASPLRLPPLAPSAWSTLRPPVIDPADFLSVTLVGPDGAVALDPAGRAALAADLRGLDAAGWLPARQLDWSAASYVQARRRDGPIVEIQRLTRSDGRRFLRFTSDRDPALRALRFFAFPVTGPAAGRDAGRSGAGQ